MANRKNRHDEEDDWIFHTILEKLFLTVQTERQAYLRPSTSKARSSSASRLETVAEAVRLVIENSGFKFSQKTVNAVLDHIVDTLPDNETFYFTPIQKDYLKSLRAIFQRASNVEHLRHKQWQHYIDFVLEGIMHGLKDDTDEAGFEQTQPLSLSFRTGPSSSIRASQRNSVRPVPNQRDDGVDHLLGALACLTNTPNVPIVSRLEQIAQALVIYVGEINRLQKLSFEVLNNLLPVLLTENLALASRVFGSICGFIQRYWDSNTAGLREQILVSLYYFRHVYHDARLIKENVDASVLDSLIAAIWSEMEKRSKKELLQLDDLSFMAIANPPPISLQGIVPASDSPRIAECWSTLSTLGQLVVALDGLRQRSDRIDEPNGMKKRRRLDHSYEDVIHRALKGSGSSRVIAIQIALHMVDHLDDIPVALHHNITRLELILLEDDPILSCWTYVLFARCSKLAKLRTNNHHSFWERVWSAAARTANTSSSSRYACYMMHTLLETGLARSVLSPQSICLGVFPEGSSGPSTLTDAAILLLHSTLKYAVFDNEKLFKSFAGRSLSWLEARWTIRECYLLTVRGCRANGELKQLFLTKPTTIRQQHMVNHTCF